MFDPVADPEQDQTIGRWYSIRSHYIFNLSYHPQIYDLLRFIQEKIANIPSDDKGKKMKSPLAASHINGIVSQYNSLKDDYEDEGTHETTETVEIDSEYDD